MPKVTRNIRKTEDQAPKLRSLSASQITVGADPEFELMERSSQRVVSASRLVSGGTHAQIGVDGSGDQVEFRPRFHHSTRRVVHDFARLLRGFNRRYANYTLSIRGDRYSLGGHIHLGLKEETSVYLNDGQMNEIVKVLDDFIGKPLRDLAGSARRGSGYNSLGAWRRQTWGVEYRVPPTNLWRNKEMAETVLKMVKRIFWMCLVHDKITYESTPSDSDYKRIARISTADLSAFRRCIADDLADRSCKDLMALWSVPAPHHTTGVEPGTEANSVRVNFSDEWLPAVATRVRTALARVRPSRNLELNLFGLREDRGWATTFVGTPGSIESMNLVSHSNAYWNMNDGRASVGVPRAFRMGTCTTAQANEFQNRLITALTPDGQGR